MSNKDIIIDYDSKLELLRRFSKSMESLIGILINESSVECHSISCRVKDRSSLSKKIEKKDKYSNLSQITDVIGLRIISNYSDEVDKIAEIIESEFEVDVENSIDKRASLDPDRFGYLSLHYVVSLKSDRSALIEYKHYKGLRFEIQIRSILQHTWAEIEHDIGYKSKIEIPKPVRRKFSRLAGLLELADDQFVELRDDLEKYERDVKDSIISKPESINIDAVSILEYINKSDTVRNINEKIISIFNVELIGADKIQAATYVGFLKFFGIDMISELNGLLIENEPLIIQRAKDISDDSTADDLDHIGMGVSIFYLTHVLAAKKLEKSEIVKFLNKLSIGHHDERVDFAEYLSTSFIKFHEK